MLIKQFLMKSTIEHDTKHCYLSQIINKVWDDRYLTQIITLHIITNLLIFENHAVKSISQNTETTFDYIMIEFFIRYASSNQITIYIKDFWTFRTQTNAFFSHKNFVWIYINDSITFWNIIIVYCSAFNALINRLI